MPENTFRSHRSRDALGRDELASSAPQSASDPLAELARLIGQSDPYAEGRRQERAGTAYAGEDGPAFDWDETEAYSDEQQHRAEERYYAPPPTRHRQEDEPAPPSPGPRFFSGPAQNFNGFRDEADEDSRVDPRIDPRVDDARGAAAPAASSGRQFPGLPPASYDDEADEREQYGEDAYAAEDDYDHAEQPPRRGGFIVVMSVLGLVVLGTAGAFGYRAMFGGSMLPKLPPVIKASNGPNKIMPSYGDSQANNASQTGVTGSTEQLAPAAEQPVDIPQSVRTAPRVVATIPIVPGQNPLTSGDVPIGPTQAAAPPFAPAPVAPAPSAAVPVPAPPAAGQPPMTSAPAPVSSEPKKVHTVTIRTDQPSGRADMAAVPPANPRKPSAPAGGNAPLSIVPDASGDSSAAAQPRSRAAAAPVSVASAGPVTATTAASGGGYAVQVTSQRSEADAQAAFRALQAKFPNQLSGRDPIIRRADLGAKGIYYRALVGPYASMEAAAEMCSSLKAAGGNCLVQRN